VQDIVRLREVPGNSSYEVASSGIAGHAGRAHRGSAAASSPASAARKRDLADLPAVSSLFPKIEGWKISDGPTRYTPETLFEYIDGGADSFLQFDFQDLISATYVIDHVRRGKNRRSSPARHDSDSAASAAITVDIYRHRDGMRAFGMYTQERPAGTTPLPLGIEGYAGRTTLSSWWVPTT